MSLFLPTSKPGPDPFSTHIAKGQLYNLDLNEKMEFQFNPTDFEWTRDIKWARTSWVGDNTGGDLSYLNTGPRSISLDLIYLADPATYKPKSTGLTEKLIDRSGLVDFQAIRGVIERWESLIVGKGRPSRISIIMGPNSFNGVISSSTFRIRDFFADLTPSEGQLSLEFKEWTLLATLS